VSINPSRKVHICYNKYALLAFLSAAVINLSCVSLSPVSANGELPGVFSSIENTEPQWLPYAEGIDYFHGIVESPRLEYYALRIDLSSPNIEIFINGGSQSTRVSSFVRDNNLTAGINAAPFSISSSMETQPIRNIGIIVSNGVLMSAASSRYDALVFYRDKTAAIVSQSSILSIENIENAIGGFFAILYSGQPAQRTITNEAAAVRHPRSAAGISAGGNQLILLVIDGRRNGSVGATEQETALLLRALGSWNGLNFDGGGSSAIAMLYPDGNVRVVNTPVHGGILGQERAVAGCIGVRVLNP